MKLSTMKPSASCFPLFFLPLKCNLRALGKRLTLDLSNKAPFFLTNPVSDFANLDCLNPHCNWYRRASHNDKGSGLVSEMSFKWYIMKRNNPGSIGFQSNDLSSDVDLRLKSSDFLSHYLD